MLTSISPVGEHARGQRFAVTATVYVVGSVVGGAVTAGLLGGIGALVLPRPAPETALAVLAVAGAAGLLVDLHPRLHLPSWWRQVNEQWLTTYRGWVYGLGFGVQLGVGVATIVPASVTYLLMLAAALSASPAVGAALGAVFGLIRALPLPLTAPLTDPAALRRALARMARAARPVARGVVVGQAAVVVLAAVAALI